MRRFRVGDRVRFEVNGDGTSRWNWEVDGGGYGQFIEGTVTYADDKMFEVDYDGRPDGWSWPQPDHHDARYGAHGYLELVKAVEDQGSNPKWVEADVDSHQRGYDAGYENGLRDGKIMVLREQEPTKTMTVDEVEEKIHICLCDWSIDPDDQRSRARAIAEALVGVRVTR